jgi:hypothetical protein
MARLGQVRSHDGAALPTRGWRGSEAYEHPQQPPTRQELTGSEPIYKTKCGLAFEKERRQTALALRRSVHEEPLHVGRWAVNLSRTPHEEDVPHFAPLQEKAMPASVLTAHACRPPQASLQAKARMRSKVDARAYAIKSGGKGPKAWIKSKRGPKACVSRRSSQKRIPRHGSGCAQVCANNWRQKACKVKATGARGAPPSSRRKAQEKRRERSKRGSDNIGRPENLQQVASTRLL